MDDERWKQVKSELFQIQVGVGIAVVLLALTCFLLWRILDAMTP